MEAIQEELGQLQHLAIMTPLGMMRQKNDATVFTSTKAERESQIILRPSRT